MVPLVQQPDALTIRPNTHRLERPDTHNLQFSALRLVMHKCVRMDMTACPGGAVEAPDNRALLAALTGFG